MKMQREKARWLAMVLSICMVMSLIFTQAIPVAAEDSIIQIEEANEQVCIEYHSQNQDSENQNTVNPKSPLSIEVSGSTSIQDGTFQYEHGTAQVIFVRESGNETYNGSNQQIPLSDDVTGLKIILSANDGYKGVVRTGGNNPPVPNPEQNNRIYTYTFSRSTLESAGNFAAFSIEFEADTGGTEPGPEPGEPGHGGYDGNPVTASVTVMGQVDFSINDSQMINNTDGTQTRDVIYTYNNTNGTVDFYFSCFINQRYTTLKVNGTDYYNALPDPSTPEGQAALLDACRGQINEFKIAVPYNAGGYTVEATMKNLDDSDAYYMVVGNFLWTYTNENQGDDYLDHGRMELLSVQYNGRNYSPNELNNPGTAFDWEENNGNGGAVLPVGSVVTVKLVPEYGYQLTSFGINGGDFGTGDEQSTFTFEIKRGNAHLGAHFTPVADKVTISSNAVTSGSIKLGNDLPGGSAQLNVSNASLDEAGEASFASITPSGYNVTDYLDVDLYNVYYKGNTTDMWKQEIDELDKDATITIQLNDSQLEGVDDPSDIVILHNVHNGNEYETISVDSYDSETNTITFKTDSFSTYAIATTNTSPTQDVVNNPTTGTTQDVVNNPTTGTTQASQTSSPKTSDISNPVLCVILLCISFAGMLGITVYYKKKKISIK